MLTYSQLLAVAERQNTTIKAIAQQIEYSPNGLRRAIENQTFPIGKVLQLCNLIGISPNEFFGIPATDRHISQTAIGFANTNNSDLVIQTLREELKQKNEQINSLLRLLPKQQ